MSVYILLTPSDCSYTLHTKNCVIFLIVAATSLKVTLIVAVLQCHERAHQKDSGLFLSLVSCLLEDWKAFFQCFTCENSWEWSSAWLGCYTTPLPWADLSV